MFRDWLGQLTAAPVERDGELVQFTEGGYAARIDSRPQFAANVAYDYRSFRELLEACCGGRTFETGLEVGCGYGRLTSLFGLHVEDMHGVDPDEDALSTARELYPGITFQQGTAQAVPLPDDSIDLLVTWTVLHHIPPEASLEAVGEELRRVLADDGVIVCCEKVRGTDGEFNWQRPVPRYEELLSPLTLQERAERLLEPPQLEEIGRPVEDVMCFARP